MNLNYGQKSINKVILYTFIGISVLLINLTLTSVGSSFPIYAQQSYDNPREATGRIVCANCHLAQKPVEIEVPQSILPNTVFEAVIEIPYNLQDTQILANGSKGALNVGAILILPEGFKLAPSNLVPNKIKEKNKNIYIQPYSTSKSNILVVGPITGDKNRSIYFPILSPDPTKDKNVHFLKYPIYAGANRGRGQIYPNGDKSNNNAIVSLTDGKISRIDQLEKGEYIVNIEKSDGEIISENIPTGLDLKVSEGEFVTNNQFLTQDPNIGGFGQSEAEIVLQSPTRIKGMIIFFFIVTISQIFFVLKKKQWEKVQAAEMNF